MYCLLYCLFHLRFFFLTLETWFGSFFLPCLSLKCVFFILSFVLFLGLFFSLLTVGEIFLLCMSNNFELNSRSFYFYHLRCWVFSFLLNVLHLCFGTLLNSLETVWPCNACFWAFEGRTKVVFRLGIMFPQYWDNTFPRQRFVPAVLWNLSTLAHGNKQTRVAFENCPTNSFPVLPHYYSAENLIVALYKSPEFTCSLFICFLLLCLVNSSHLGLPEFSSMYLN